jgi:catechol 2,3-dioxygenase-like lactoylglutathione lyase family enzyme
VTTPPGFERVDHVAIEVTDFDERIAAMTNGLGLACRRIGRYGADQSRRIAMLADPTGFKIELIEAADGAEAKFAFAHIAWLVRDVTAAHDALVAAGYETTVAPRRLDAARADTALLRRDGLPVQVIRYDHDSPDR